MALVVASIAQWFIKIKERSFFILELPAYRSPRWRNVVQTMISKAKIFVFDAGKVIMIISLILWALSSFGPGNRMKYVTQQYEQAKATTQCRYRRIRKGISIQPNWKILMPVFWENQLNQLLNHWVMIGRSVLHLLLLLLQEKFLLERWQHFIQCWRPG